MKKKILTTLLAGVLAFSAFGLAGCADSAYDIAVKNGFTGTEQEWLQSLQGADGQDAPKLTVHDVYEEAVASGEFSGSFSEFLESYLALNVPENNNVEILAKNVLSTVSIYTGFETTETGLLGQVVSKEVYCTAGSGVIVDLDREHGNATVITNYHVVYDSGATTKDGISEDIWLYLYGAVNAFNTKTGKDENGDGIKARFVGGSMDYDIAVLKIQGSNILKESLAEEATFGDSNSATVGEKVYVVGNPQGMGIAVSEGVLSVDSEYIGMKSLDGANRTVSYRVMRTDAAVNGGNSGGPLFNSRGELIAIVNAKSIADGVENVGYALPATQVLGVMENVKNNGGSIKRATLGVTVIIADTTVSMKTDGTLLLTEKIEIAEITKFSAAYNKLQTGDIMKSMIYGGITYPLTRRFYVNDLLLKVQKGDTVSWIIERNGKEMSVEITFDKDYMFTAVQ